MYITCTPRENNRYLKHITVFTTYTLNHLKMAKGISAVLSQMQIIIKYLILMHTVMV
jgi:hypothetical protein